MRALANAARMAHGNPELMHLRTLQAVGETNGTVVLAPAWPAAAAVPGGVVHASLGVPLAGVIQWPRRDRWASHGRRRRRVTAHAVE